MNTENNEKVDLTLEGFIKQHPDFFDSEFKKGVFMMGCLTEILLAKQRKKFKSEPFSKNLNGLNIDEKTIQNIFPKLINKLREYETALPELESEIAKAIVCKPVLSKVEISYAFTLGMVMQREFTNAFFRNKDIDNQ